MDRQDTDAVNLARRDGLRIQFLVPETDESRQLRRVVLHVFRHRIVERTEIRILLLDELHVEEHEQLLQQFVQRHEAEFVCLQLESCRQVAGRVVEQHRIEADVLAQYPLLISHRQPCQCDAVVG